MEEFVFEEEATIEATFQMDAASGNHQDLDGRDLPDQHPTSAITGLDDALSGISTSIEGKVDKVSIANQVYGTDENGDQTTYDVDSFGQVDDVQVGGVSVVTNKIAELGTMAGETASDYYTKTETDEGFATAAQGALADTAIQPLDNISELNNDSGYITASSVKDGTLTIQKNGVLVATFTANQEGDSTANLIIPTTPADIGALPDSTTIEDLTTTAQLAALNSGATSTNIAQIATNTGDISTINGKIPSAATTTNQLADKDFVNSSIATNTANFIGTFNSVADLEAYSGTLTNNDYAFVVGTDSAGNTKYDRYKYTTATTPASWEYEYTLNNSSFTSNQWAAINSGATTTNIGQITTNKNAIGTLANLTTTEKSSLVGAINELDNDKQENITGGASTITDTNLTANRALISNGSGKVAVSTTTNTELGYLSGTTSSIQTQLNGKASTSLDNLSSAGQMIIDSQNGTISNCILEIPQDIKLELNNGTLTLKSGSVVALTGYNTYTTRTTNSDIVKNSWSSHWYNKRVLIFIGATGTGFGYTNISSTGSGSSLPSDGSIYTTFYLTTDNTLYEWSSNTWTAITYSYPLCVIDVDSNGVASFAKDSNGNDMIFNGVGFIGHHVFVYPNVKALLPDGFNDDGSLKSKESTTNSLQIIEVNSASSTRVGIISANGSVGGVTAGYYEYDVLPSTPPYNTAVYYEKSTNKSFQYYSNSYHELIATKLYNVSSVSASGGISITDFTIRQPYDGARNLLTDDIEKEIANMQTTTNLVTSVSSASTDSQYPSAKLLYDTVGNIETLLHNINSVS
jgi:hypothetical protein